MKTPKSGRATHSYRGPFTSRARRSSIRLRGGAGTAIDLGGAFVIPALGEAHNHNLDTGFGFAAFNAMYLEQGIFFVKNPNSVAIHTAEIADRVRQPDTVDAVFSMGGVTVPRGHPERLYVDQLSRMPAYSGWSRDRFVGQAFHFAAAPDEAGPVIATLDEQGADFVKTYLLNTEDHDALVADPDAYGNKGLSPDSFSAVIEAAHTRGLRTTTHVETAFDFRTAVQGGTDEINHLPGYFWWGDTDADTYRLTEADALAAAEANVVVVTTTAISAEFYGRDPDKLADVQALQVENLQRLDRAGVKIAIGSDNYFGTATNEARHLVAIGAFPTEKVLKLWIDTPKNSIFPDRAVSCLDPGCEASFLVMEGDPSADLAALEGISLYIKDGEQLDLSETSDAAE